ncbi:MAG: hexitol phosphatase HxpB [Chloroflexota bacterium]
MHDTGAVIFDMDGLLIDTEPVWRRVEIEVFGQLGLKLTEQQCMETMGVRVSEVVKLWYDRCPWKGASLDEVTERIVVGVIAHVRARGEPNPGACEALQCVHDAGLPIAIASSSSEEMIRTVVKRLGVGRYIRLICSADDESHGKPDPAVYLTTARKLGVPPHRCVALEDSPNGVLAAKAAGMYCIAVPDRHLAADPRLDAADVRIPSMEQFSLELLPGVC